jgi:acetyl-CoA acetyltransferase
MASASGSLRGRVALVGVGTTAQGELPGRSANSIAVEALGLALTDAGIDKGAIDGLITCKVFGGSEGIDTQIGALAGISPRYSATLDYGTCNFSLHLAAMAISSGLATTVAILYGTNQRSSQVRFTSVADGADRELLAPHGFLNIAGPASLALRRRQHLYGLTEEQLGHVAVVQRRHAQLNPLAVFREPLTIDDYLASRYIVRPLRRPDICMISDGGACLIVTGAERAGSHPGRPVYLLAADQVTELRHHQTADALLRPWVAPLAERVYAAGGITRDDVDVLLVQDATSLAVVEALELFGFCRPEDVGGFLAEERIALGRDLPVNTNGGQLSEAYMWGWLHLCEAVRQLRGECGDRQVKDARVAQYCSSQGFRKYAVSLLGSELP